MAKKYDMAVKTGSYQDRNGTDKNRYENIGEVHSGNDNSFYARMNPFRVMGLAMAAIARGDDSMMVSLFAPRTDAQTQAPRQQPAPQTAPDYDDDIPF